LFKADSIDQVIDNYVLIKLQMVKTGEQPQNQPGTADKLSRLKQTLTTGLLQAHESGKHKLS